MAAVVSDLSSSEELRPERRNLSAHQQVLNSVIGSSRVVLPVSFGTIAGSPDSVRLLLERYHDQFAGQMQRVQGKMEMGARLYYCASKPNFFEYLVGQFPELQAARDQMVHGGREATREEKIDLGQRVEAALASLRENFGRKLEQALTPVCRELRRNPPRGDQDIARTACLLPKNAQGDFETAVKNCSGQFPSVFALEQSGPFPPYDFVEMHLKEV
jgi:hypothetical protein